MLKDRSVSVKVRQRVCTLLGLDGGATYEVVKQETGLSYPALRAIVGRYNERGMASLQDAARSGRPPVISGEQRAKLTALACSKPPGGHAVWSLRLLADRVVELGICEHLSHVHAGKILKKTNFSRTASVRGASGE